MARRGIARRAILARRRLRRALASKPRRDLELRERFARTTSSELFGPASISSSTDVFGGDDIAHLSAVSTARYARVVLGLAGAFGGAVAAVTGTAVGYGYMLGSAPKPRPHCDGEKRRGDARGTVSANSGSCVDEALRRRAYDGLADSFDDEIEWHELMTGIKLMRWWMMRQARGDVLEVAAGCVSRAPMPSSEIPRQARVRARDASRVSSLALPVSFSPLATSPLLHSQHRS